MAKRTSRKKGIVAVDLFCGAGGLTRGLEQAGVNVRLGIDVDPECEFPYQANNKSSFLLKSVAEVTGVEINAAFGTGGHYRLLAGCAPCQLFSSYQREKRQTDDQRWTLLKHFARLIKECSPELVTMENVPRLQEEEVFRSFVRQLEREGYHVSFRALKCADYGVPQRRQRLVLLASKLGQVDLIEPTHAPSRYVTVRKAIAKLPQLKAGEADEKDPLHIAASLTPLNLERIKASRPGGTWRQWDRRLIAKCHLKASGETYSGVYARMSWDDLAPTMTTQFNGFGNGRFGHPQQHRAISIREGAILQSFPRHYRFLSPGAVPNKKILCRLIGNAVPVLLGKAIGRSLLNHVESF